MTTVLIEPVSGKRVALSQPAARLNITSEVLAALEADAAVRDVREMADQFRVAGAVWASAALDALAQQRKARANKVWARATHLPHACA